MDTGAVDVVKIEQHDADDQTTHDDVSSTRYTNLGEPATAPALGDAYLARGSPQAEVD